MIHGYGSHSGLALQALHGGSRKDLVRVVAVEQWPDRKDRLMGDRRRLRRLLCYPEPFELKAFGADGLAGTLPCEARACSLSLSARVFRSFFRPLTSRSENSRGSIEESKLVSGEGFDHRLQARRIKRKITRTFLIRRPMQKPSSERWERRVNPGRSFGDCQ
jgi:hypothetical protein